MNTPLSALGTLAVAAPTRHPINPSHRVLVVDDDGAVGRVIARMLARFGYHVDAAEDGAAGWEALRNHRYDLVITDHKMPKLSGVELVVKLRAAGMALAVILMSAVLPADELERNPQLQLAAVLPKPFSSDQLLETVKEVLRAADNDSVPTGARFPALVEAVSKMEPQRQ